MSFLCNAKCDINSSCRYFAGLLVGCFQGATKQQLLSPLYSPVADYWEKHPLVSTDHD